MKKTAFYFDKPETPIQWVIFLAAIGIILSSPHGTRAFLKELHKYIEDRAAKKKTAYNTAQISQALYYAKKRKLIRVKRADGKTVIELTERGRKRKLKYDIDKLRIPPQGQWDGRWRIVMFDIPESKRRGRVVLTDKLKHLGFLQFQKSVWIYPYPCEDEIDFVTEFFGVAPYVNLISVKMENDKHLRRNFKL